MEVENFSPERVRLVTGLVVPLVTGLALIGQVNVGCAVAQRSVATVVNQQKILTRETLVPVFSTRLSLPLKERVHIVGGCFAADQFVNFKPEAIRELSSPFGLVNNLGHIVYCSLTRTCGNQHHLAASLEDFRLLRRLNHQRYLNLTNNFNSTNFQCC